MEAMRAAIAWLVLLLVAWQALASVLDVADELGQKPWRQHVRVLEASPEELIQQKLGDDDFVIWQALRTRLPRDAKVQVSFADERSGYRELRRRITWLGSLLYPIVLEGWPFDPARSKPPKLQTVWRGTVLDLESGRDFSAWKCQELARGVNFRLLLVEIEPQ
jgi:hypothetical protein